MIGKQSTFREVFFTHPLITNLAMYNNPACGDHMLIYAGKIYSHTMPMLGSKQPEQIGHDAEEGGMLGVVFGSEDESLLLNL